MVLVPPFTHFPSSNSSYFIITWRNVFIHLLQSSEFLLGIRVTYFVVCCFIFTFLSIRSFIYYLEVLRSVAKMTINKVPQVLFIDLVSFFHFWTLSLCYLVLLPECFGWCLSNQRLAYFHSFNSGIVDLLLKNLEMLWHGKILHVFKTHMTLWPWLNLCFRQIFSTFK